MEIVSAYELVGSYRGAAALCGTTHKTVKRIMNRRHVAEPVRGEVVRNTAGGKELVGGGVGASDGRISAKRLLPTARAAGYSGSARNFRRAVAEAKAAWKRQRRNNRPRGALPGQHLVTQ